jgi:adenylyltransferase/sulfurtransferase
MGEERYSRQIAYAGIGESGQRRIGDASAAVIGAGALGSVIAEELVRAGVGRVLVCDRDYVAVSNLQRQFLYDERDAEAELPKALAAAQHLAAINSEVVIEPFVADINAANIEKIVQEHDILLDGTDNFEVRMLMNEASCKYGKPYVYGAALGAQGAVMNILPGGPCLRCIVREVPDAGTYPTCATAGVIAPATAMVASMQVAEALKILSGSDAVSRRYCDMDLWNNSIDYIAIEKDPDCPVCGRGAYEYLGRAPVARSMAVCGRDEYQITPGKPAQLDLGEFEKKLGGMGDVKNNRFSLSFKPPGEGASFVLFGDGRAIIRGVRDEAQAKSVYSEYIGL